MADFVSSFWSWFIIIPTAVGILAMFWLIRWLQGATTKPGEEVETMGHVWDKDLEEYNNPLPAWWLNLFYITLVFGIVYLILYPGMGSFRGVLGWTQLTQYEEEVQTAEATYGPLFEQFSKESIKALVDNKQALQMGERLYATYCTVCHGSDARGVTGYPNLRDNDWQYGGAPEQIKASILDGRNGVMPAWEAVIGEDGVRNVSQYVLSLSDRKVDAKAAEAGKTVFATYCAACHMPDGTGNTALGAPNLTNNLWLYGGSPRAIEETIAKGRSGKMPAHRDFLGEAKVHLLATYIYSLSR